MDDKEIEALAMEFAKESGLEITISKWNSVKFNTIRIVKVVLFGVFLYQIIAGSVVMALFAYVIPLLYDGVKQFKMINKYLNELIKFMADKSPMQAWFIESEWFYYVSICVLSLYVLFWPIQIFKDSNKNTIN
jgi:hypothetical protein